MAEKTSGFTLIEVTIVVAIIGILAATAIPLYQGYVVQTQLARTVGELSVYRAPVEDSLGNNKPVDNDRIGFKPTELIVETTADPIAAFNADGSGHLQVTLGDRAHPRLSGVLVSMVRSAAGDWECVIDNSANATAWKDSYMPSGCRL